MSTRFIRTLAACAMVGAACLANVGADVVDFDDLSLAPDSYNSGPMPGATPSDGGWGSTLWTGTFDSGGASFTNQIALYGTPPQTMYWGGFAYSNMNDRTTEGYTNQYSTYAVDSSESGGNFAVAFGYEDVPFDPQAPGDFGSLPTFALPTGASIEGMSVTNTTYAALSMLNGDSFAKKFEQGDWFKLTAYGFTDAGLESVDFFLADFRSSNAADHYILDTWEYMDLSSLAGASRLWFNVSSSDVGPYGMNTPGYFAVDDIRYSVSAAVPEPSSLAAGLSAVSLVGFVLRRRRALAA